jgi:hypothetical protein
MTDYEKLKEIYDEIDHLIEMRVSSSTPRFRAWKVKAKRFLIKRYGEESYEVREFQKTRFSLGAAGYYASEEAFIQACRNGLATMKEIFDIYLNEIREGSKQQTESKKEIGVLKRDFNRVFIVHGHNGELKEGVARLLEQQGIQPIILHEQVNRGATIIEKIESNSDVQAAVCLFTADDYGHSATDQEKQPRARQNVVFEAGYFMGKLGRENIVIISDKGVELPSDLQGVVYTDTQLWKMELLKELKAIGYSIDFNKAMS